MANNIRIILLLIMTLISISCNKSSINPKAIKLNNQAVDLLMEKKYEEALILLEKATSIENDYLIAHGNIITTYLEMRDYEKALFFASRFTELFPESTYGFLYSGLITEKLSNFNEAQVFFDEMIELYRDIDLEKSDIKDLKNFSYALKISGKRDELAETISKIFMKRDLDSEDRTYFEDLLNKPRDEYIDSRIR